MLMYACYIIVDRVLNVLHSVGRIIGVGIFSMPSLILGSVGSVGASLVVWVVGFILSFCESHFWQLSLRSAKQSLFRWSLRLSRAWNDVPSFWC